MKSQNEPVRILQIGMTKNIGGLETYLMQQFRHLDKSKITYDFVNITAEDEIVFKQEILDAGSHVYGVRSRHSNPIRHYWQWLRLLHKIGKNYKAIVLNSNGLTYVFPLVAARLAGIPMRVMHSHNSGFEQKIGSAKKAIIAMNRILLKWGATDYFSCSKVAGEWMFGKNAKFTVIPNAIDIDKFRFNQEIRDKKRTELEIPSDYVVIGHVGRFTYQKNHEFLVDVFNEYHKKNPRSVLLLVGGAVEDNFFLNRIHKKVKDYELESAVRFLGMRNDVPELMMAMDYFILPSRFEGLPVVGLEAQASGLVCLFSNTITDEIKVSNLAIFESLNTDPAIWAGKIMTKAKPDDREMYNNIVGLAGYDIKTSVSEVCKLYLKSHSY